MKLDKLTTVVYSADDFVNKRKNGTSLDIMDQTLLSIKSIRERWSMDVPIALVHTQGLSNRSRMVLDLFKVDTMRWTGELPTNTGHKNGNKLLITKLKINTPYFLLLDGDTIVHKNIDIVDYDKYDLMVTYAGKVFPYYDWKSLFEEFSVTCPKGCIYKEPMYEYIMNNKTDIFPWFNTGVVLGKTSLLSSLYNVWSGIMRQLRFGKRSGDYRMRAEPIAFTIAIHKMGLNYGILPKGYNFNTKLRTLRGQTKVYISHYCGASCALPEYVAEHIGPGGVVLYDKMEMVNELEKERER